MATAIGPTVVIDHAVPERRVVLFEKCLRLPHARMAVERCQSEKIPAWRKIDDADGKGLRDDDGGMR